MIVEYTRYRIPVEHAGAFEAGYAQACAFLAASNHCLGYELSRCVDEPGSYILRIEWDSAEGHMRNSEEFRRFFALVRPYVSDILEMRHYERLAASGGGAA